MGGGRWGAVAIPLPGGARGEMRERRGVGATRWGHSRKREVVDAGALARGSDAVGPEKRD